MIVGSNGIPYDYDWLSDKKKNEILDVLNAPISPDERCTPEMYNLAQELADEYGVSLAWNWEGNRRQWILVDSLRLDMHEDWKIQCSE